VKVETDVATSDKDQPSPDLSVSASKKNGVVVLSLVNPFPDQDLEIQCALRGATAKDATGVLLHDADWNACNSFDAPDHVVPKPHPVKLEGATLRLDLPRMSVATLTLSS
jgi:alpha-N-arabinofuranosidase